MDSPPQSPNHVFKFPENEKVRGKDPKRRPLRSEEWGRCGSSEQVEKYLISHLPKRKPTCTTFISRSCPPNLRLMTLNSDEAQDVYLQRAVEIGSRDKGKEQSREDVVLKWKIRLRKGKRKGFFWGKMKTNKGVNSRSWERMKECMEEMKGKWMVGVGTIWWDDGFE
ncbi:hypothetical protein Tco_1328024 [Tanacetum coccineum]